jgi:Ni,Fe-hydrogenase III component G
MSDEQTIQADLLARFPALRDKIRVARPRRVWVDVEADQFGEVFDHLVGQMGFSILCTITGLDEGEKLGLIYHLARTTGHVLNLHVRVPKDKPEVRSIIARFPAAEAYEREVADLLGFQVKGLPEGNRYPLPDNWPQGQFPLRKDWKIDMLEKALEKKPKETDNA